MAQHDYALANASGSSFRSDLNDALSAIVSVNSGTSAPSTTFAYMLWADTTNGLLKQRNAANSAWIIRATLAETRVVAKSSAYTVIDDDFGKLFKASGTWDLTLTAAATLGDGFFFSVRNTGSGTITINPDGSEQIDGATTLALAAGEGCDVWCDGSAFFTIGKPATASTNVFVPVRQTVLSGPVDSNGLAAFGGSTGGTTVTASGTLYATAANGFGSSGAVDVVCSVTNPSWTGLSTNGTMYLYLDISGGVATTGSGTLGPVVQEGGTYSTTSGQFTFNRSEMVGKVGNGSSAVQTYRVYVGEVTVAAGVVSAIRWYPLMNRYRYAQSASGTAVDVTGIPAGVTRIKIMVVGLSAGGASNYLVQIGDAGGLETSGYSSSAVHMNAGGGQTVTSSSAGFICTSVIEAADAQHGQIVLNLAAASSNTWTAEGQLSQLTGTARVNIGQGSKSLSGTLDRVRVTTVSGDTFDAGTVAVSYD